MSFTERLDRVSTGPFHRRLLVVSGLGWMFDAMDVGLISFVLPALARDWKLDAVTSGFVISAGFLGMFLGAAIAGSLADRFGRRTVFQATLVIYSLATGLCAFSWDIASLLVFRFMVGLGLGGELPVASTLVSEFSPAKDRGRLLVILESFWAYGWAAAALIGWLVIPSYGWRVAFLFGTIPALYVFFLRRQLPESPRFLLQKGDVAAAEAVVREVEGSGGRVVTTANPPLAGADTPVPHGGSRFAELWSSRFARRTIMLWILWFGMVYAYYGVFTWLPTILATGRDLTKSYEYALIITLAQIPGYFSAAYLVEKIGRKWTLASYLFLTAVSAFFFGQSGTPTAIIVWGCLISFFNLGAWGVIYTYTPEQYPTRTRGTGAGFAAAIGRVGGIVGPYVVGWLLGVAKVGTPFVFAMFAVVFVIIALDVGILGEETTGRSLEEIAG